MTGVDDDEELEQPAINVSATRIRRIAGLRDGEA
jgi:hypothetical protein